ncbi:MAG: hypothetical protein WD431_02455 [Cyclobacteriaceae bacterium]
MKSFFLKVTFVSGLLLICFPGKARPTLKGREFVFNVFENIILLSRTKVPPEGGI